MLLTCLYKEEKIAFFLLSGCQKQVMITHGFVPASHPHPLITCCSGDPGARE